MEVFAHCHAINGMLRSGDEQSARDELIKLLASLHQDGLSRTPLVNHFIRAVGLFPYLEPETAAWQERFVHEAFKANVGAEEPVTLHREQSRLLSALLSGKSIAVSAPTSFGKSFVIDAFIAMKKPRTVVILVPTIALADETRRRLQRKFGELYKLITTADQTLADFNIFVFPQERSVGYVSIIKHIDILIVDEFYKASVAFDKDRSPSLIRAIINLSRISSQRYFLAPNITELSDNPFTDGMEFMRLDFNTVYLEKNELFNDIGNNELLKSKVLLSLLDQHHGKTLIYAGTYSNIAKLTTLLTTNLKNVGSALLNSFQQWLEKNYDSNWSLSKLVERGVGVHNGKLHRSLSQIQIRLFEDEDGLRRIVSTSSIIEGVNTSAENVVLWSNKNGRAKINDFTYKNIIGRGGRMFRHFIGKIFILEPPPPESQTQLELEMPDELLGTIADVEGLQLTREQMAKIDGFRSSMQTLLGVNNWSDFIQNDVFQSSNSSLLLKIAEDMRSDIASWNGLGYLNSNNPKQWERHLFKLLNMTPGGWSIEYTKYVEFVKVLSNNWYRTIPQLLVELDTHDINIEMFFDLERNTTFKLSSLLGDVQTIYNQINRRHPVDLSIAISRISHAFLPSIVYQLEEYGVPRMISRKIHDARVIDLEAADLEMHEVIQAFRKIGLRRLLKSVGTLDEFDAYVLQYFYEGIEPRISDPRVTND